MVRLLSCAGLSIRSVQGSRCWMWKPCPRVGYHKSRSVWEWFCTEVVCCLLRAVMGLRFMIYVQNFIKICSGSQQFMMVVKDWTSCTQTQTHRWHGDLRRLLSNLKYKGKKLFERSLSFSSDNKIRQKWVFGTMYGYAECIGLYGYTTLTGIILCA
jgi:hypothetical protein